MYRTFWKRLFDILFSILALLVLFPLIIVIWVNVRLFLGKPAIYKQKRPGLNEKIFTLYKFRTMNNHKNSQGELLPDCDRLTGFGRLLRSTSLDELPELWNILRGDMSFVGPRPLLVKYLPLYSDEQKLRHSVRPGLTGLAQVRGRNSISWEDKFKYDLQYVMKVTLLNDLRIIVLTVWEVLHRRGISSGTSETMEEFRG